MSCELHSHRSEMAIGYIHASALRANAHFSINDYAVANLPQKLQSLTFNLLFLAADERYDIVSGIKRGHTRIARARESLHGRGHARGDAKPRMQWRQRHYDHNSGTVW